jgi:hypothetical protein
VQQDFADALSGLLLISAVDFSICVVTMPLDEPITGRLAENILYFARVLRAAGIPVGPGAVLDALHPVAAAGVGEREDFYRTQPDNRGARYQAGGRATAEN